MAHSFPAVFSLPQTTAGPCFTAVKADLSISLCYEEMKLFHSVCQNILLPTFHFDQEQKEDAALVYST